MRAEESVVLLNLLENASDRLSRRERAALARMRAAGDAMAQQLSGSRDAKRLRTEWLAASGFLDDPDFGRRGL